MYMCILSLSLVCCLSYNRTLLGSSYVRRLVLKITNMHGYVYIAVSLYNRLTLYTHGVKG